MYMKNIDKGTDLRRKYMRKVIAIIEVNDDKAIEEDIGTIDYLEREFVWLSDSEIFLQNAKILDEDDVYDARAIELANEIFN